MDLTSIVPLLLGLLLTGWGVRQRLGRSEGARAWPGGESHDRAVLVLRPALGLLLVVVGLLPAVDGRSGPETGLGLLVLLVLAVGIGWGILPLPVPRWSLPGWYVRRGGALARRRARKDVHG
jgi:hypothetical protein